MRVQASRLKIVEKYQSERASKAKRNAGDTFTRGLYELLQSSGSSTEWRKRRNSKHLIQVRRQRCYYEPSWAKIRNEHCFELLGRNEESITSAVDNTQRSSAVQFTEAVLLFWSNLTLIVFQKHNGHAQNTFPSMEVDARREGTIPSVTVLDAMVVTLTQPFTDDKICGGFRQMLYAGHYRKYMLEVIRELLVIQETLYNLGSQPTSALYRSMELSRQRKLSILKWGCGLTCIINVPFNECRIMAVRIYWLRRPFGQSSALCLTGTLQRLSRTSKKLSDQTYI